MVAALETFSSNINDKWNYWGVVGQKIFRHEK